MQGYLGVDLLQFLDQMIFIGHRSSGNDLHGLLDGIQLLSHLSLLLHPSIILPVHFRDLAQVARACRRNDVHLFRGTHRSLKVTFPIFKFFTQTSHHQGIESVHAGIVKLGCHGSYHRKVLLLTIPKVMIAHVLLAHIAKCIEGASLVKLIECNQVCEVEHVNLLQLGRGPVLWGHHVKRQVRVFNDLGVGLPDAGGFKDNKVKSCRLHCIHRILHVLGKGEIGLTRSQRAHVDTRMMDGIHANAVAE